MTDQTQADTNSRPATQHKGERKTILELSVDYEPFSATNPNLIDLDAELNEKKVVGAVEPKLLQEKRQKRMALLAQQASR